MTWDLSQLGPNMRLQLTMLACGPLLGEGAARVVFECGLNPRYVVKLENKIGSFQNICEWEMWNSLKNEAHYAKWLAPCERISVDGGFLIQRRTLPLPENKRPKRLPVWLCDLKPENFGLLDGRVVCHDYGTMHIHMTERGISKRMVKAKWRANA